MLVLSRKVGEDVVIPELGVVFTIIEVQGERVRVGIKAPPELLVFRRELWERIQARNARENGACQEEPAVVVETARTPEATERLTNCKTLAPPGAK